MTHGWHTTKTADGFKWTVVSRGYQVPTVVLQSGLCNTRAVARGRAKAWCLYYRRHANALAAAQASTTNSLPSHEPA